MSDPAERAASAIEWATLMHKPAAYIDLTRLAACFGGHVSLQLCERLRAAGRLQNRLSALISEFYALAAPVGPQAVDQLDQTIALLPAGQVGNLVRRAGAIYWANAIANVVRAEEVRRLRDQLGEAVCAFALANRNLSGPPRKLEPLDGGDARIMVDGMRCLGAWCQSQADAVGARVRLKSPAHPGLDEPASKPFDEIGPAIIRCAAS